MSDIEQAVDGLGGEVVDSEEQPTTSQTSEEVQEETPETNDESQEEQDSEIEYDGEKYRVPPKLKDAFLRFDDYTKKTQEVASTRQEIEQQRAAFEQERQLVAQSHQRQQANLEAYANLKALDNQLKQYSEVDWSALSDNDPVEAQKHFMQYNQLRDQRGQLAQYLTTAEQLAMQDHQATLAKKAAEGRAVVAKEIPNWSDNLAKEVSKSALEIGLTEAEISQIYDPRHVKVLYYAKIGMEAMKKAKSSQQAPAQPLKTVKSVNTGDNKDPDSMTVEEWNKWREKQLKRK
jgi:hypothetical protein